jgi:hypothetical protein
MLAVLILSISLLIIFAAHSLFYWREGLEGSCRKLGLCVGLQRLRHVPESEGKGMC